MISNSFARPLTQHEIEKERPMNQSNADNIAFHPGYVKSTRANKPQYPKKANDQASYDAEQIAPKSNDAVATPSFTPNTTTRRLLCALRVEIDFARHEDLNIYEGDDCRFRVQRFVEKFNLSEEAVDQLLLQIQD